MTLKTVDDLLEDPMPSMPDMGMGGGMGGGMDSESPYDRALDILTVIEDAPLELMTRTNPIMARACAISYSMMATFRSTYVGGRINQTMRLAVSSMGRGREEIVRSLGANSETFNIPENPISQAGYRPAIEEE